LIPMFHQHLKRVMDELESYFATDEESVSQNQQNSVEISPKEEQKLFDQLKKAADKMELEECKNILNTLQGYKFSERQEQRIEAMVSALDEYDFDRVLELIEG